MAQHSRKVLVPKNYFSIMNKYLAELLGAFAGDGWMSKGNSGISLFITGKPKNSKHIKKFEQWLSQGFY